MSLVPDFELGLWNAWIFTFYLLLHSLLMRIIDKDVWKKMQYRPNILLSRTPKKNLHFSRAIRLFLLIYSIFLPLKLGSTWFYLGLPICLLGSIMWTIAWLKFATTPLDEPVTQGLYRYSRHPMFLSAFLVAFGVSIASASWLYFLLSILGAILRFFLYVIPEERFCLEKYGNAYRKYMNRTPRWIGIPKSEKKD